MNSVFSLFNTFPKPGEVKQNIRVSQPETWSISTNVNQPQLMRSQFVQTINNFCHIKKPPSSVSICILACIN